MIKSDIEERLNSLENLLDNFFVVAVELLLLLQLKRNENGLTSNAFDDPKISLQFFHDQFKSFDLRRRQILPPNITYQVSQIALIVLNIWFNNFGKGRL